MEKNLNQDKHVCLGVHKLVPTKFKNRDHAIAYNQELFFRSLNLNTLVVFVGSGCSSALGYPNWKEFVLNSTFNGSDIFKRR